MEDVSSSQTLPESTLLEATAPSEPLNLRNLPPVFVLPTHLTSDELQDAEEKLIELDARLTYDIKEAEIVLGAIGTKRRAEIELRSRQIWTKDITNATVHQPDSRADEPTTKKRKTTDGSSRRSSIALNDASTESDTLEGSSTDSDKETSTRAKKQETETVLAQARAGATSKSSKKRASPHIDSKPRSIVRVAKLEWLKDSEKARQALPVGKYAIYEGEVIERPSALASPRSPKAVSWLPSGSVAVPLVAHPAKIQVRHDILERAKADLGSDAYHAVPKPRPLGFKTSRGSGHTRSEAPVRPSHATPRLLPETTSYEDESSSEIPPPPDWVKRKLKYACQRATPRDSPNAKFIAELKTIKLGRLLTLDEIGVRAYSTSIAAVAAYPYAITSPREITRLPGCDAKIANLWVEWKNTGEIQAVKEVETDATIQGIHVFYDIWGVGATTAQDFYMKRGWRDLDDVVEYGWNTLSRVQQIGVKFYYEFQERIPRAETDSIAAIVREHAVRVRDEGIECIVVGSHRRGSEDSGDVDVILSHRTLAKTKDLVVNVVASLESEGWITHTLTLNLTNSERQQSTLPYRAQGHAGHGFDSLDKALVVWQNPIWPTREENLAKDPNAKNPALHRRVDIIISPWRTVGCAILGWSGETTFQRDIRRYAKYTHKWKFDSSGIRSRATGELIKLEGPDGVEGSWKEAERRVFEGLGIEYREPWERCTG